METETERRTVPRRRVFRKARVARNAHSGTYDVLVANLSPRGAKLKLSDMTPLGPSFLLLVDDRKKLAQTVWREGDEAGIEFIDE